MKVFFIASIHGKRKFENNYRAIIDYFRSAGHTIEAEHVLGVVGKDLESWDDEKDLRFHKSILTGIKGADIVVAELSYSSVSVGYLVSVAVESGKPTIALYSGEEVPHLLTLLEQSENFQVIYYSDIREIKKEIPNLVNNAMERKDSRFNFFVPRRLLVYLDWISKNKRIPRAVYLRQLITREMMRSREYEREK